MAARLEAFEKDVAGLKETELDTITRDLLKRVVVLVETPQAVKVITYPEVWVPNPDVDENDENADTRLFAGETAISSVLWGLYSKEKPAVLFVTAGAPASGFGGGYSFLAERFRKSNYIVQDWDILQQREMPQPPNATKIILMLLPPPPTPEMYQPVIDAVKAGAPALLIGEPTTMMQPPVPYGELFDLLGIEPRWGAIAVRNAVVNQEGDVKAFWSVDVATYPKHIITRSMDALPSQFFLAAPLPIKADLPAGVTAEPIVTLPASRECWIETNVMSLRNGKATRDPSEDITTAAPLAVAATRQVGGTEQKVVMFGSSYMARNNQGFERMLGQDVHPGNGELFVNSLLWVSGSEHLITVSPEALRARRVGDMGSWALPLQIGLIGGLPALVLVSWIIVYVVRRG
jgi:hypothetical protein